MIASPLAERHYGSARKRFLQSSIEHFLDREFPRTFGPVIRQKIAQQIVVLVDQQLPAKNHLRPGQCVWNAVSIRTRADSPHCQLVPVVLTLIDPSDIEQLASGTPMSAIARQAIARNAAMKPEAGPLAIGLAYSGDHKIGCDGQIDEVRISRGLRPMDRVPEGPFTTDAATLGLWHFDDDPRKLSRQDSSGHKRHAELRLKPD